MEPYDPQPPPATPRMSGCQKWAIGCAIGCGGLVLLAVVAGGVGSWWLVHPGKQQATAAVVSPRTSGAFTVSDLGTDPGVSALLDRFVREAQRQQQRDMPGWVRQMQQMSAAGGSPSSGFRMFLPRQATVSLEPSTEGRDGPAVAAALNLRGLTRLLHLVLARGDTLAGQYRQHDVLRLGPNAWGSLVGGTLLVASEEGALHAAIDRFLDGGDGAAPPPVDLGVPSRSWDVVGAVDETSGGHAGPVWGDEPAPPGVRRTLLGVDVATSDRTEGRLVADCDSAGAAAAALVALDQRAAQRAQDLAAHGMTLRTAGRVDGTRAVLDWELSGVDAAIAQWMAKSQERSSAYREAVGAGDQAEGGRD